MSKSRINDVDFWVKAVNTVLTHVAQNLVDESGYGVFTLKEVLESLQVDGVALSSESSSISNHLHFTGALIKTDKQPNGKYCWHLRKAKVTKRDIEKSRNAHTTRVNAERGIRKKPVTDKKKVIRKKSTTSEKVVPKKKPTVSKAVTESSIDELLQKAHDRASQIRAEYDKEKAEVRKLRDEVESDEAKESELTKELVEVKKRIDDTKTKIANSLDRQAELTEQHQQIMDKIASVHDSVKEALVDVV